jgi:hypothetical protein
MEVNQTNMVGEISKSTGLAANLAEVIALLS